MEENCHLKNDGQGRPIDKLRSELKLEHVRVSHLEIEGTVFQAERQPMPRLNFESVLAVLVLRNSQDTGEAGRSK